MVYDITDSPGHVYCLQEASTALCKDLRGIRRAPQSELDIALRGEKPRFTDENKRKTAKGSPAQHWLVVRGTDKGPSIAVAVRDAFFQVLRRDCFVLQDAGTNDGKQKFNKLMVCTLKCRTPFFYPNYYCEADEFGIAVAHLNNGCATKRQRTRRRGLH